MQNLTATIPHRLSRREVKRRVDEQIAQLHQHHGSFFTDPQTNWVHDTLIFSFRALGQAISGHLDVDDHAVHLTVELPWLMRFFAGPIQHQIEQTARKALAPPAKNSA
jgi:hypothetical protein